jgi:RND family efflux transporter MFP subunit
MRCHSAIANTFVMLSTFLFAGCGTGTQTFSPSEPPSVNLPVVAAIPAMDRVGGVASGTVEADNRAQLVARASGTIHAIGLYDGQPVQRGQILATIDARLADVAVRRARGALDAALAEQHDARGDVTRDAPLAQSGALSGDAFRKEQLRNDAATAGVVQARAGLAAAEVDRSYTSLVSPIDGVVVARQVRDGDTVMPGSSLMTIEGRDRMLFRFAVPQASLDAFEPGSSVPVLLDGREDRPVIGRVRGLVPSADPATRRYTVEIILLPDRTVLPGMFGSVRLPQSGSRPVERPRAVSVPTMAVVDRGGLAGVFVVSKDRRVSFRWLRLGDRIGDRIIVTSGLSAGERILARVDPTVRDGARLSGRASQ